MGEPCLPWRQHYARIVPDAGIVPPTTCEMPTLLAWASLTTGLRSHPARQARATWPPLQILDGALGTLESLGDRGLDLAEQRPQDRLQLRQDLRVEQLAAGRQRLVAEQRQGVLG